MLRKDRAEASAQAAAKPDASQGGGEPPKLEELDDEEEIPF